MTKQPPEIDAWDLKVIKTRYKATYGLDLSPGQAKKVYNYEKDKDLYSEKHFLSVWEEWDYELTSFRELLNKEQLKKYQIALKENIKRYEKNLADLDKENLNSIDFTKRRLISMKLVFYLTFLKIRI